VLSEGGEALSTDLPLGVLDVQSGDYLYRTRRSGEVISLLRKPVQGGEEEPILDWYRATGSEFALASEGIYFVAAEEEMGAGFLWYYELESGQKTKLTPVRRHGVGGGQIAVSPDGTWLLYTQNEGTGDQRDIMLVENFR